MSPGLYRIGSSNLISRKDRTSPEPDRPAAEAFEVLPMADVEFEFEVEAAGVSLAMEGRVCSRSC